ncbi:MAG TPA: alpha-L-fucosidase [Bacteroidales bacterium]|nr:alpha-L-fucosidase [Bacteroidales bacterium]
MRKIVTAFLLVMLLIPVMAQNRADWLRETKWGVMIHYQPAWLAAENQMDEIDINKWNELIDNFDCEKLAKQLSDAGAGYLIMTVRHGPPFFISPNKTYDRYTGQVPSRCSKRDLVADLADALNKYGIKLITYIHVQAPGQTEAEMKGFALDRTDYYKSGPFERNPEAMLRWQEVIREYSARWGDKVAGWWLDAAYRPNTNYRYPDAPNFASFSDAARAGNPDRIVTYNPGRFPRIMSITPYEDYTAGEINDLDRIKWAYAYDGKIDGKQMHILSFLGNYWGQGAPRFDTEKVIEYSKGINDAGGAITWDVPPLPDGTISDEYMEQLLKIGEAL